MSFRSSKANRVAIVGASTLRGKEVKQALEGRKFPADEIVLLDESVMAGTLTEAGGEPTFIRGVDAGSFADIRYAFFAGSSSDAERNWQNAQRAGTIVIDLTGALANAGHATTRIPGLPPASGSLKANGSALPTTYFSPPAPVVIGCTVAVGLANFRPLRTAMVLFPPVSERDEAGVEELAGQTTSLFAIRPMPQTVFDTQVAFNLNLAYGAESKPTTETTRREIARRVAQYLNGSAIVPAIQLVQAPVFHGYAFSAYAEFETAPAREQTEAALTDLGVEFSAAGEPPPSNVTLEGESLIRMAPPEADPQVANAFWLWGVADSLRLQATNAVRIAEERVAASTAN